MFHLKIEDKFGHVDESVLEYPNIKDAMDIGRMIWTNRANLAKVLIVNREGVTEHEFK